MEIINKIYDAWYFLDEFKELIALEFIIMFLVLEAFNVINIIPNI